MADRWLFTLAFTASVREGNRAYIIMTTFKNDGHDVGPMPSKLTR